MKIPADISLQSGEEALVDKAGATTVEYGRRGLNWKGRIRYDLMVWNYRRKLGKFYRASLAARECYYGPFVGEFGHFLLHNLPFLTHLYSRGVRIHYCGMELHKPFLVDESGRSVIESWFPLRDFFGEVRPNANQTVPPTDVQKEIAAFQRVARASGKPFLDISDTDLYWFVFRNWQLDGRQNIFDLSKVYGERKTDTCVIFPRKKGGEFTPNNGGPWDYSEVARRAALHFDRVCLVGHPAMSSSIPERDNIELRVSANNADMLKYCSEASLIITQHSGAVHLGAYTNTPVLVIFNGEPPIRGLIDTIRFRKNLSDRPLNYAFNLDEIENFARQVPH